MRKSPKLPGPIPAPEVADPRGRAYLTSVRNFRTSESRWAAAATVASGLLGLGCSVDVDANEADAGATTHAVISVERSTGSDTVRAHAIAGFVQLPASARSDQVLDLVGLAVALPETGTCRRVSLTRDVPLANLGTVQLVPPAGNVEVVADGEANSLAMRAFPTVSDAISGVVYTTRDQSEGLLPAEASYSVRLREGTRDEVVVAGRAPAELSDVRIGGVPFEQLASVTTGTPMDITWTPGSARDVVYVEIGTFDTAEKVLCSFADDAGTGTVAGDFISDAGEGLLAVHRVREVRVESPAADQSHLRFDFELSADVDYAAE